MPEQVAEPRWRRLPEERPKQILEAALAVFAERGLAAARLEDIAKRAGVSKGTIYLYFANKEELSAAWSATRSSRSSSAARRASPPSAIPIAALDVWMEGTGVASLRRLSRDAPTRELRAARLPRPAEFYAVEVVGRAQRLVCEILERGMETGVFRRMDARGRGAHAERALRHARDLVPPEALLQIDREHPGRRAARADP